MKRSPLLLLAALLALVPASAASAADYTVDHSHSTVSFKVRHLFSKVLGEFKTFEGSFSYDAADLSQWKVEAKADAASIDTNTPKRDEHLRSKDFFDTDNFPAITFKSTGARDLAGQTAKLEGVLTIRGVEKPVTFDVEVHGEGTDPWGNTRLGLTATTKIDRKDFGLTWNETLETGQLLVGEEIEITLEIEGLKK
jgi:polyisoprenoid-binding protein YceI